MVLLILSIVTGLVIWALRLMDKAVENQEFSLMLAGFLVASSAAAIVGIYFLMGDYMLYINQTTPALSGSDVFVVGSDMPVWLDEFDAGS